MISREGRDLAYPFGKADADEAILSEILNAIHWHSGIPTESVRVAVRNGRVVLRGRVERDYERDLAESAAWGASGVTDVVNEIEAIH